MYYSNVKSEEVILLDQSERTDASLLPSVPTGKRIEEEEEEMRRVRRLPAEGQLRRLRPLQERQEPPDLQGAPLRKTHREEDQEGGGKSKRGHFSVSTHPSSFAGF